MKATSETYYEAFVRKDRDYEGVFFVGVKTTGVFCRPTCPARKPKLDNCEFFNDARSALLASYRPCKRCRPLDLPDGETELVRSLVDAVEEDPERRWKERDFQEMGVDPSTVRRQFKKRFGMTFVEYARSRRMGMAMEQIRTGDKVIEAQIDMGYESGSGFRDAFSNILGSAPSKPASQPLSAAWIDTRLGPMLALADETHLHLLEFVDRRGLEREVDRLRQKLQRAIVPGRTDPIARISEELSDYFKGDSFEFKTPIAMHGSPFQKSVWEILQQIPPGSTRSYSEIAKALGRPSAVRAVARANGSNQLAIVIPCHRVIQLDGGLGGYAGGIARKQWLLDHEKANTNGG
ncbi:MAG: bifunctional transcriptional activator/DNA repair protein Ada [Candidatus Omnitrophica bacterium]|nr:bifunctional transcriptional activator/DNA repair protein Ada [Candidatus Omnitrophota bacterium]